MSEERKALEDFLIDNPELERLEALLDEFNIFEALGAVKVELRHSEFLAFLMNPTQSHGLGDFFVKRFLQKAVVGVDLTELPFTAIDLDIWDLDELEVRREWNNIDILLLTELSDDDKLAVIIENKIDSKEHSDQLARYYQIVKQHFPGWKILGLYLTPEGDEPSDERYLPVSYETVSALIESISASRKSTLGPDIYTLMQHYLSILRRYILSGSEIEKLSQEIYRKHQRALDILFEHRPDLQAELYDFLLELVENTPDVTLDHSSKSYIRFVVDAFDVPILKKGEGWTPSKRMLLFEFKNLEARLGLYLLIGPGPNEIREKLFELSKQKRYTPPLKAFQRVLGRKHQTIYQFSFLTKRDYENSDLDGMQTKIKKQWAIFISKELPRLNEILKEQPWLWESNEE